MSMKVIVCGAAGRMGRVSCAAIESASDMTLLAGIDQSYSLQDALGLYKPDAVVDFTVPESVFENTQLVIQNGICPVVGATGLTPEQITQLQAQAAEQKLGGIIAPNFSIAAVLMMQAAAKAAQYYPHAEIIEMHHNKKVDSPSGTALKTAALITQSATMHSPPFADQTARGEIVDNIAIHSVRLPGYFASQSVIFGGSGEIYTLRHDSVNREAMMPGLLLALRQVKAMDQLVYGLEHLLDDTGH